MIYERLDILRITLWLNWANVIFNQCPSLYKKIVPKIMRSDLNVFPTQFSLITPFTNIYNSIEPKDVYRVTSMHVNAACLHRFNVPSFIFCSPSICQTTLFSMQAFINILIYLISLLYSNEVNSWCWCDIICLCLDKRNRLYSHETKKTETRLIVFGQINIRITLLA